MPSKTSGVKPHPNKDYSVKPQIRLEFRESLKAVKLVPSKVSLLWKGNVHLPFPIVE